ncbi:hypothetical protein PLICRDRAFT_149892 [Plicaturopsis crispa FD-325 SS-3]|nr:hypothetical protein PLICRDRAFT_149892 [Plicaturopsis crispa FD-325 SS-3]
MSSSASSSSSSSSESDSEKNIAPTPQSKRKREPIGDESDSSDNESASEPEDVAEVSALSHAERRRQKKKAKLDAKAAKSASKTRTGKEARTGKEDVPAAQGKRQHSVWVGNMTFKTTVEALKGFFDGVGEITRVNMPMKLPSAPTAKPENRGFAYVDFATPEAKIIAITMSEKPLNGRRLLIKDGDDYTGRPALAGAEEGADASKNLTGLSKTAQKILRAQKQPPAPTLFLGNLGFETTEQSIRELLEAHRAVKKKGKAAEVEGADEKVKGKEPVAAPDAAAAEDETKPQEKDVWLRKVRMGTFEDSGLCKGFAFVDFTSTEHATAALVNPKNHSLDGRKLVVEYASADAVRRGGGPRPKREDGPRNPKDKYSKETRPPRRKAADNTGYKGTPREARARVTEDPSAEEQAPPKRQRVEEPQPAEGGGGRGGRDKSNRPRSKPGAALALAKRESAAIVPSQGKKTHF